MQTSHLRSRRGLTAALAGSAALLFAAGCGSDSSSSSSSSSDSGKDAAQITKVTETAITTTDATVKCVDVVTRGFVTAVYGDLSTCKKAEAPSPDDAAPATGATTTGVTVSGDKATAVVTVKGGDTDGATGKLSYEREDGTWKVSELGIDFLRSQLKTGLEHGDATDKSSPLNDPKVASCIGDHLQSLDDAAFRALAYAAISDKDPDPAFVKAFTDCAAKSSTGTTTTDTTSTDASTTSGDESVSLLRRQFETGIREAAVKDGATEAQVACVVKELRSTISDDEIVAEVGKTKTSATLAQRAAKAIQHCG